MKSGKLKKLALIAYLLACLPLYADIGDSTIYAIYEYRTLEEMNVNTILENIDLFVKEYNDKYKTIKYTMPLKNGRYIKDFKWNYYFAKSYNLYKINIDINLSYFKNIFSSQKQFVAKLSIIFIDFPPDIGTEPPDSAGTAKIFSSQFENFMNEKKIKLERYYVWEAF